MMLMNTEKKKYKFIDHDRLTYLSSNEIKVHNVEQERGSYPLAAALGWGGGLPQWTLPGVGEFVSRGVP